MEHNIRVRLSLPFLKSHVVLPFSDNNLNTQYTQTLRREVETILEQEIWSGRPVTFTSALKMAVDMLAAPPGETKAD